MKKTGLFLIFLFVLAGCTKGPSNIKLPSLIGNNMLLQQKTDISIRGHASAGCKIDVSASWDATGKTVTGKDGKWSVSLGTPEAGGPYTITISAKDTSLIINNVLIGEVWVCSGQSNMEMPLEGWPPADTVMYSAVTISLAILSCISKFPAFP